VDVKVEHLEGHVAQLTVTVEPEETLSSKKMAARRLARKVRIPGFRPGKAPYQVIVNMLGDGAILEEALEEMGQELYKAALEESEVEPAAPGEFVDFKEEEGQLVLTYTVPKMADVDLKGYRDIREPLEPEEVTDEMVNRALESLRDNRAVVEDTDRAAKVGDEVALDIKMTWWHEEDHDHDHDEDEDAEAKDEAEAEDEAEEHEHDEDEAEEHEHEHGHEHAIIDDRNTEVILRDAGDERDVVPGFSEQVIGLKEGDEKTFELVMPEDFEDESLAGETITAVLTVNKVRNRTLPELNDTFAASATEGEQETLLDLRIKIRSDLEESVQDIAKNELFNKILDRIVEEAELTYHQVMIDSYVDNMLQSMDATIRQQANMSLEDFLRVTGQSMDELREGRREDAEDRLRRDLVVVELAETERIRVKDEDVDAEIEKMAASFGKQGDIYRQLLDTPQQRENLRERIATDKIVQRVVDISTGNAPSLEEVQAEDESDESELVHEEEAS
jgi:trigger factor